MPNVDITSRVCERGFIQCRCIQYYGFYFILSVHQFIPACMFFFINNLWYNPPIKVSWAITLHIFCIFLKRSPLAPSFSLPRGSLLDTTNQSCCEFSCLSHRLPSASYYLLNNECVSVWLGTCAAVPGAWRAEDTGTGDIAVAPDRVMEWSRLVSGSVGQQALFECEAAVLVMCKIIFIVLYY